MAANDNGRPASVRSRLLAWRLSKRFGCAEQLRGMDVRKAATRNTSPTWDPGRVAWQHTKADGTRDARFSTNELVREPAVLSLSGYLVSCDDAGAMLRLVRALRDRGLGVEPCEAEAARLDEARMVAQAAASLGSADHLAASFEGRPHDFERWCARLLQTRGYRAHVTPASGDGGYDIVCSHTGRRGIAECKCFRTDNTVGRPLIQKLVGANAQVGADELIFMTTSTFTAEARDFARQARVTLLDGAALLGLAGQSQAMLSVGEPQRSAWELTDDDLVALLPPDLPAGT